MKLKKHIRYSEAFKQQVVEQIEAGKFRNMAGVNQAYGIRGSSTVIRWIKQYGSDKSLPQQIKIMSLNEIDEARELKKRVRELERALWTAHGVKIGRDTFKLPVRQAHDRQGGELER